MAQKIENIQYPVGKKSKKSDREFLEDVRELYKPVEEYYSLTKEYAAKLSALEEARKNLEKKKESGLLGESDRQLAESIILNMEEELKELKQLMKDIAKENSEIVTDPRYSQIRFKNIHGNPDIGGI